MNVDEGERGQTFQAIHLLLNFATAGMPSYYPTRRSDLI
jgi:hypothetical protein